MTPVQIKIGLLKKGIKQRDLAKALNRTPGSISQIVNGTRKSPEARKQIYDILKKAA